jgi:SAM-dependent methyltransferase
MSDHQSEIVRVDLGCGIHKPDGFIGVDVSFKPGVDVVADLNQSFPFPDNSVDFVRAHDVVEHLSDHIHTMNEIWRICKSHALIDIRVPSTDGRGAFQDPTHISFWNINSFKYYCVEFPDYLELCQTYGFKGAFSIISLSDEEETPDGVIHTRAILKAHKADNLLLEVLREKLKLKEINLIVFPDWSQTEDILYPVLTDVIRAITLHRDRQKITLLVDQSNFPPDSEESVEQIFYDLGFNLLLTENIEIADEDLQISLIKNLSKDESATLLQQISYRISLPQENLAALEVFRDTNSILLENLENLC